MIKETLSLKIKAEIKAMLEKLSKDGRSQTYHLERAISNYYKIKIGNRLTKG